MQLTYSLHTIDINRILQSVTLQTGTFDVEFSWNEDTVDGILKWISFWSDKKAFSDIHDVKYVQFIWYLWIVGSKEYADACMQKSV